MPLGQLFDSVFGGGQRAKDKRTQRDNLRADYKYRKGVWRDNRDKLRADDKWLREKIKTDQRNAEAIAYYQDQTNVNNFNDRLAIRDVQIQQQNAAYDKSVSLFNQQMGFNNRSRNLAIRNARTNFDDGMKQIEFQRKGLINEFESFVDRTTNTLYGARDQFKGAVRSNEIGKQGSALQFAELQRQVATGSARFQAEYNQQRAQAAFENQDAIIKALQDQGAAEARGVTGNTAGRLAQNAMSSLGRNQALLSQQLLAGNQALNRQLDDLQGRLQTGRLNEKLSNVKLDADLINARNKLTLTRKTSEAETAAERRDYALNKEILLANQQSLGSRLKASVSDIMNKAEGARIQALSNLMLPPVDPPMPTAPIPTPIPEFQFPRELEDFDFGPEPILQSAGDVNGFAPLVQGLDAAFQIAMGIAGIPSPPMNDNGGGLGSFGDYTGLSGQPFDFGSLTPIDFNTDFNLTP